MPRCRLRFLLQELDLPLGVTTIGRSANCHVTLDDPLVSRRHARIVVGDDRALVEDTGSRNGVTLNGVPIRTPTRLHDADRVRLGTHELVFSLLDASGETPANRLTGHVRLCAACRFSYPREMVSCPKCKDSELIDEDTLTGGGSLGGPGASSMQLLVEALERALALGRVGDAQRIVARVSEHVAQLMAAGGSVDSRVLAVLASQTAFLTAASRDPTWALWVLDVYCKTQQIPPIDVVERLAQAGEDAARHAGGRSPLHDVLEPFGSLVESDPVPTATGSDR